MTTDEMRAEAIRLGCFTEAFERLLGVIEWCDRADADLAALQRSIATPRCPSR